MSMRMRMSMRKCLCYISCSVALRISFCCCCCCCRCQPRESERERERIAETFLSIEFYTPNDRENDICVYVCVYLCVPDWRSHNALEQSNLSGKITNDTIRIKQKRTPTNEKTDGILDNIKNNFRSSFFSAGRAERDREQR